MTVAHRACAQGHDSAEDDYCSVCGDRMPAPGGAAGGSTVSPGSGACPDCGELRVDPSAHFCEVCRYDFAKQKPGPIPRGTPKPGATPSARAVHPPAAPAPAGTRWEILVQTDASLDDEPDPDTPFAPRADDVVSVEEAELLIGRTDPARDIHPEIALHDPGASRRHAKIVLLADGGLALQDLASTNGTRLNKAPVPRGGRLPLANGDEILVGRWTRLTVRREP
jgi:hypothetical protein